MPTKDNPGRYDCLANALPDEPYFVLLARDAAGGHEAWLCWIITRLEAIRDGKKPLSDISRVSEALDQLYAAQQWHRIHSRPSRPDLLIALPGPADRAWITRIAETLKGHAPESAGDRLFDEQGIRR